MQNGTVSAVGPLKETLTQIQQPIALGQNNSSIIDAIITAKDEKWQLCSVQFGNTTLCLPDQGGDINDAVRLQILAKDVSLTLKNQSQTSISNIIAAEVMAIEDNQHSPTALVQLQLGDDTILARLTRRSIHQLQLSSGTQVWAQIKSAALIR